MTEAKRFHNGFFGWPSEVQHIRLTRGGERVFIPSFRRWLSEKTDDRCWYCGDTLGVGSSREIDHVVPTHLGGTDDVSNLVPACGRCNSTKGTRSLEDYRALFRMRGIKWPIKFSRAQLEFMEQTLGVGLPVPPLSDVRFYGEQQS